MAKCSLGSLGLENTPLLYQDLQHFEDLSPICDIPPLAHSLLSMKLDEVEPVRFAMNLTAEKSGFVMRLCRSALSVLMILAASGLFAQKVHVKFDRGLDFSKFKTYAWLESKHPADKFWDQRVMAAIDRQFTRKGLTRVDGNTNRDLEVVYNSGVKERTIVQGYDYGYVYTEYLYRRLYGPLWFWPVGPGSWVSEVEKNGSLVVDLVDASRKDMVWRGVARDVLSNKTEKNEQKLNKAIEKMFKKYPPEKCKKIK